MTSSRLSLRHNFSWTFAGNVIYAFCLWGILSVQTKLGTPATVGRFAIASAIASPIIMFASLQLRSVLAADAGNRHSFAVYLAVRLLSLPTALLVILLVAVRGYSGGQVVAIVLFGLARSVESVSDIYYGLAQKNDRMDLVAYSKIIKGLAALVFFGITFAWTRDLNWSLAALGLAWLLPLLAFDIPRIRQLNRSLAGPSLRPSFDGAQMRSLVWLTLPLGLVILMGEMRQTIPRTVLEAGHGEDMVGIFAALSYLVIAGSTVVMALGQASLARLAQHYEAGRIAAFKHIGLRLAALGVGFGVAGVAVAYWGGPFLLTHLYAPEYGQHADLFVLIMAGGGALYLSTLLAPLTTAMRAFRGQMVVQAVSVGILLALAPTLIGRLGMTGAAWTVLIASCWTVIGFLLLIRLGLRKQQGHAGRLIAFLFE